MDINRRKAYLRLAKNYENNNSVSKVQSNGPLSKSSPNILHTSKDRRCLPEEQERQNIKKLLKILLELEDTIEGSINLSQFQKAQINNMLSSVQSLVQSLSIQYSNVEMPNHAYSKLTTLIESLENLVYSIISDNDKKEAEYGIFQDRISNLSPSVSSKSIGRNYEDELIERTNNVHINRTYGSGYYDNDMLKRSDEEDSEFDDEEVNDLNDRFANELPNIFGEPYRETHREYRVELDHGN